MPGAIPGALAANSSSTRAAPARVVYSESAILLVALPDLSMPYNVIAISSTLVALFAGSMFNIRKY